MEPTDADLVAGVLAGDRDLFGTLVERHGRVLLGYLQRRARGPDQARELFQETWVRAYEGLGRLKDGQALRPWLIAIASNTLIKRLRRAEPLSLEELGPSVLGPSAAPGPGEGVEREELRARIEREVAGLPGRQREVFELRALSGLSHADVAALLGIREDAARANYYQAVRKLRARLEDELR